MTAKTKSYIYPLSIIATLFFSFGFLMWLTGILIPYFQICLDLSNVQASLVAFASYIAYFAMALPSAWVLKHSGYKKGMVIGLIIMALGTVLFIPAAYTRTYPLFLTGLFITGGGVTLLQTAVNPYVAIIGPIESTAQRIGFMGLANKFAGILSTAILGSIFLFDADAIVGNVSRVSPVEKAALLNSYSLKIVDPYIIITAILLALAVIIYFSKMPEINEMGEDAGEETSNVEHKSSVFHYPYLLIGVVALFFSAACEGLPIDGIVIYGRSLGVPYEEARHFTQYTLYAMIAGYAASTILIPRFISQQKALLWSAILGIGLTIGAYYSSGEVSMYCLVCTGFGAAMLWGTIWGLAIRDLGKFTKVGSAMLLMSVVGGGIFPLLFGKLIDLNSIRPQNAVLVLVPCYLVLVFFSSKGYKIENWRSKVKSKKANVKSYAEEQEA
ncbi:sugar MFS transporter [Pinibacter soli]|uniref:Sugar MFS transporter n=1 Tax=Pinibacter soli TaxID=3044211 RepID=A0ABT6R719_9BACT|nr:sugar MFS transporter [Pinibacter soli]MDI3318355.1 sugar MFS transporter [Pinibacter soli]